MISEQLGIRPWEQRELLTGEELLDACAWIDAQIEASKNAAKGG